MQTGYDPFLYRNYELDTTRKAWDGLNSKLSGQNMNKPSAFGDLLKEKLPKDYYDIPSDRFSFRPSRREILEETKNDPEKKKLYEASLQFESYFMEQVFRQMKKNIPKSKLLHGGPAEDWFDEMLTTERVAQMTHKTEFGLAEQIYASMRLL